MAPAPRLRLRELPPREEGRPPRRVPSSWPGCQEAGEPRQQPRLVAATRGSGLRLQWPLLGRSQAGVTLELEPRSPRRPGLGPTGPSRGLCCSLSSAPFVFWPAYSRLFLSQIALGSFGNPLGLEVWMWGGCIGERERWSVLFALEGGLQA